MVVVRQKQACTRRKARHLKVGTVLLLVLLMGVLAQQIVVRALMGVALHHGYDGIEEYLEVGFGVGFRLCGYG